MAELWFRPDGLPRRSARLYWRRRRVGGRRRHQTPGLPPAAGTPHPDLVPWDEVWSRRSEDEGKCGAQKTETGAVNVLSAQVRAVLGG
jgi:hypothetical protein